MREVQHAEDAEDEREPAGDEKQEEPVLHPVDQLQGEERRAHFPILQPTPGSSAAFIATPSTVWVPPLTWRR